MTHIQQVASLIQEANLQFMDPPRMVASSVCQFELDLSTIAGTSPGTSPESPASPALQGATFANRPVERVVIH